MTPPPDGECCFIVNPAHWQPASNQGIVEVMTKSSSDGSVEEEINIAIAERISRLNLTENKRQQEDLNLAEIIDTSSVDNCSSPGLTSGPASPSDLGSSVDIGSSSGSDLSSSASSISKEVLLQRRAPSCSDDSGVVVATKSDQHVSADQQAVASDKCYHAPHHRSNVCNIKKAVDSAHQDETTRPHSIDCGAKVKSTHGGATKENVNSATADFVTKKSASKPPSVAGGNNKWVSPQEFFQANRQRSCALANKVSTTSTFGTGSGELLTHDLLCSSNKDKKTVDDITKGLSERIQRSPIPTLANNRHVVNPYQLPLPKQQAAPPAGMACRGEQFPSYQQQIKFEDPRQFMHQQRQRASPGQQGQLVGYSAAVLQQQNQYLQQQQMQLGQQATYYPPQHQDPNSYASQEEYHRQAVGCLYVQEQQQPTVPLENCYMNLFQQGQAASPQAYNNAFSPCVMSPVSQYSPCSVRSEDSLYYNGNGNNHGRQQTATDIVGCQYRNGSVPASSANGGEMPSSPFTDEHLTNDELNRLLNNSNNNNPLAPTELPEAISDFILKYSRRYSVGAQDQQQKAVAENKVVALNVEEFSVGGSPSVISSRKGSTSSDEGYHGLSSVENVDDQLSACGSPYSTTSTAGYSPAAPQGAQTPTTPTKKSTDGGNKDLTPTALRKLKPKPNAGTIVGANRTGRAKQKLRELISNEDFDVAWAWAVRCSQACPGALFYRDPDGDSLLHIVVWHKDLSKIYALTEIMVRDESQTCLKPFDLPNKLDETPLFLAVEKRMEEVVAYALENSANPNHRTRNRDGDAALHYAASRGMTEIVQVLCASPLTNLNLLNGAGLTPLLCAVKNHGVIEEESQCLVNNKPIIRILLKAGADPKIPDAATGKTVLHYSVERMDPDLVQLFRDHLDKESMGTLVNMPTYTGETALHILGRMASPRGASYSRGEGEEELRRKMFMTLVDCGADITLCESPDPLDAQFTILDPSLSP